MDRMEGRIEGLLRRTRTVAVVGASPRSVRHSHDVVHYLHEAGYDVIPVRSDRSRVCGIATYARLEDVGVREKDDEGATLAAIRTVQTQVDVSAFSMVDAL
jgi:predicted CoA-binding protein